MGRNALKSRPMAIRYARNGDVSPAYKLTGDGPLDLVFAGGFVSHLEIVWGEPSSTVKDLAVGSGIQFADRGEHELKGVLGPWRLYAVGPGV